MGMFSYTEIRGQASYHKAGEVRVNHHYYTTRKPGLIVLLRLLGLAAMVAVGYGIAVPTLKEFLPLWQVMVLVAGAMLIYTGIAFFVRPEANGDNMGIVGGLGDDPFQYADDVNRLLFKWHCLLGPGRFAAETLLDVCVLAGIAGGDEVVDLSEDEESEAAIGESVPLQPGETDWSRPPDLSAVLAHSVQGEALAEASGTLSPNRFERRR
jgi:hypothetical protein